MRGLVIAVSFLTRIPVPARINEDADIAQGVPWFSVVGAAVGLASAAVYGAALELFPPFLAATLALLAAVLVTGAFHEDGLADTFDALVGGWTKEERMRILKDPTHGTYGVVALVLSLMVRAGAIATFTGPLAIVALPAAHALSRAASVALLGSMQSAGQGLGASYAAAVTRSRAAAGVLIGLVIGYGLIGDRLALAVAGVAVSTSIIGLWARAKVGGITGDLLGANQQVAEITVLLVLVALA